MVERYDIFDQVLTHQHTIIYKKKFSAYIIIIYIVQQQSVIKFPV